MKVFASPNRTEIGKFQGVIQAFDAIWDGLVIDVGCRSGNLKRALPESAGCYYGLDLSPPAHVIGNIEQGLPFKSASSDTIVALDILEHTDNIHKAFEELCRVARKYVLVTLPNAYEIKSRIKFLFGRRLSGKYGLPLDWVHDRHRWIFSFREARAFTRTLGQRYGFEILSEGCLTGPRRMVAGGRSMVGLFPDLLAPWYVALLSRRERPEP